MLILGVLWKRLRVLEFTFVRGINVIERTLV